MMGDVYTPAGQSTYRPTDIQIFMLGVFDPRRYIPITYNDQTVEGISAVGAYSLEHICRSRLYHLKLEVFPHGKILLNIFIVRADYHRAEVSPQPTDLNF